MSGIEQLEHVIKVIKNSDYLHATPMQMIDNIEPTEPNAFEKGLLKGTITPSELIEQEKKEAKEVTKAEIEFLARHEYITKVKVIGLHRIGKHPLYNGSFLKPSEKERLKTTMEKIMLLTDEQIQREFNDICIDNLFDSNTDYSTYPVYDPLTMHTFKVKQDYKEEPREEALNRNYC